MRRVNLETILTMARAAAGSIDRIFLHWTAGHYEQMFGDYHYNITGDGLIYCPVDSLTQTLAHTWRQNSGAVGVALCCCYDGNTHCLGPEPPTEIQVETMAQVVAALCLGLGLPPTGGHVRTHAEQADMDGYGPATTCERWDLWYLGDGQTPGSGGEILRGKAAWYMEKGVGV